VLGYLSYKAIDSVEKSDDTQWLTFWLLYSIVHAFECVSFLWSWLSFYNELKIALYIWLGFFRGAELVYTKFIQPIIKRHEEKIDKAIAQGKEKISRTTQ